MMMTIVLTCLPSVAHALDRANQLDVVGTVRGRSINLHYDDVEENKQEHKCYDLTITREVDPVCASNGKKYANPSTYEFHKCLTSALEELDLQVVDMEVCLDAELEDNHYK
ncbi:unnamed protein product [Hyaloperonospora brassicae]|uniref:Kazal-like domain-containing protein n=1 Tax=Hyaloperonospora brassicae TaxID=162125 RepID=A0AAV0UWC6_HYABA|nr:unnamed protein product [Hyaloperonospora brassicae]